MRKIYSESVKFFLVSLPALVVFAGAIEWIDWYFHPRLSSATFIGLTIVAYFFHRHFLFGESLSMLGKPAVTDGAPPVKYGWFILISVALGALSLGLAVVVALQFSAESRGGLILLVVCTIYLLMLSLFGIALPASVARDNTYRVAQGIRVMFGTMWRLLAGPGVVGLTLVLAGAMLAHLLRSYGVAGDSLIMLAFNTILRTLGFLTTLVAVAVLCEMYRKTRPALVTKQGAGAVADGSV